MHAQTPSGPTTSRVDAHQHFWQRDRGDYDWLQTGDEALAPLLQDFLPTHYMPLLAQHGVSRTVLVQATATDAETDFLLTLASRHTFIGGVVGWVDLTSADVEEVLTARARQPNFKGVRPMLQDLADPDWLSKSPQCRALPILARCGLSLDLLVRPHQLVGARASVESAPELAIVIDHAAKPPLSRGWQDASMRDWRRNMQPLAALPNTMCKFSGLLNEAATGVGRDLKCSLDAVRPVWDALLDWFGPHRLMWGSDWPVLQLSSEMTNWVQVCEQLIGELSPHEQVAVWAGNAQRFYRLALASADLPRP